MAGRREYGSRVTGGNRTTTAKPNVRARNPKEAVKRVQTETTPVADEPAVTPTTVVTPPPAAPVVQSYDPGEIRVTPLEPGDMLNRALDAENLPKTRKRMTREQTEAARLATLAAYAKRAEEIEVREPSTFSADEKKAASAYMSGIVDEIDAQIERDARRNPRLMAARFVSWLKSKAPAQAQKVDYALNPTLAALYYPDYEIKPTDDAAQRKAKDEARATFYHKISVGGTQSYDLDSVKFWDINRRFKGRYDGVNITDLIVSGQINRGAFGTLRNEYTMEKYSFGDVMRTLLPWNVLSSKPSYIQKAERVTKQKAAAKAKAANKASGKASVFSPQWFKELAPVQAAVAFFKEPSKYAYTPREVYAQVKSLFAAKPATAATAAATVATPATPTSPVAAPAQVAKQGTLFSRLKTAITNKLNGVTDENHLKGVRYLNVADAPTTPKVQATTLGEKIAGFRAAVAASVPEKHKGLVAAGLAVSLAFTLTTGLFSGTKSSKPADIDVAQKPTTVELKTGAPAVAPIEIAQETCPTGAAQLDSLMAPPMTAPAIETTAPAVAVQAPVVVPAVAARVKATIPVAAPAKAAPVVSLDTVSKHAVAPVAKSAQQPNRAALKAATAQTHVAKDTVAKDTVATKDKVEQKAQVAHKATAKTTHAPAASKVRNVPADLNKAFGLSQAQFDNMSPKDQGLLREAVKSGAATHVEYTPINPDKAYQGATALLIAARNLSGDMTNATRNAAAFKMYEQAMRLGREGNMYGGDFLPTEIGKYAKMLNGVPGVERNDAKAGTAIALAHWNSAYAKQARNFLKANNPKALEDGIALIGEMKERSMLGPFENVIKKVLGEDQANTPLHPAKKTTSKALQNVRMSLAKSAPSA